MESVKYQKLNGNYDISCQTCDKEFPMVGILELHLVEIHKVEPVNACDLCGTEFKRKIGRIFRFFYSYYFYSHLYLINEETRYIQGHPG